VKGARMNKRLVLLSSLLLLPACQTTHTVTLVGMTDYHSHAEPFYSEGEPGQEGVARALAYFSLLVLYLLGMQRLPRRQGLGSNRRQGLGSNRRHLGRLWVLEEIRSNNLQFL
jgi:hypothetical protein